ncbi:putative tigger transposable element-derived protein 6-like [Ditylenchus destructor]|uniref:Tigger transposable element-derived protein 6-like n=1 Tax=Ditylenchus destructor TaxID=166010 RepID=A0AAD4MEA7_9BILA|nr:putative tigger transposable element-derived protein 6-like [Ditylenchus destructor]
MEFLPPTPAKRKRLALSDAAKKAICVHPRSLKMSLQRFNNGFSSMKRLLDERSPRSANEAKKNIRALLEGYQGRDVYNMDETGLFFRLPPNRTLATRPVAGQKQGEDHGRLETVMEPTQIKDAIAGGKAFLSYLEQNQVASGEEILTVMNLTDCLVDEEIKKRRQAKITEFLR